MSSLSLPKKYSDMIDSFLSDGVDRELKELNSYELELITPLGKPGAGKGTLIDELKKDYHLQVLGTGKVFFNPFENDCFTPKQQQELADLCKFIVLENKQLLPDDVTMKAVSIYLRHQLDQEIFSNEFPILLDVFPRTIGQYDFMYRFSTSETYVLIDVDDETSLQRQRKRAKEQNRPDNGQEKERLQEYNRVTAPLVDRLRSIFYSGRSSLQYDWMDVIVLDGHKSQEEIKNDFLSQYMGSEFQRL